MGELLGRPTIREPLFTDLEGWVKSLGAWGGDFVMIASPLPAEKLLSYLAAKGLTTVFNYNQLVNVITSYSIHYTKLYDVDSCGLTAVYF